LPCRRSRVRIPSAALPKAHRHIASGRASWPVLGSISRPAPPSGALARISRAWCAEQIGSRLVANRPVAALLLPPRDRKSATAAGRPSWPTAPRRALRASAPRRAPPLSGELHMHGPCQRVDHLRLLWPPNAEQRDRGGWHARRLSRPRSIRSARQCARQSRPEPCGRERSRAVRAFAVASGFPSTTETSARFESPWRYGRSSL
jgi:hypothetical protein